MQGDSRMEPSEDSKWQEIRQLWGDKLVPISPDLMGPDISDFTRSFVIDVGLPTEGPLDITFYHDERLLSLLSIGKTDYLAVGEDYGTSFGIKIGTDELWAMDPDDEQRLHFVNSRLSNFVLFLGSYGSRQDRQYASDEQNEVIVQEMRQQFMSRDPRALADVENWWSLIFEQMSDGLL